MNILEVPSKRPRARRGSAVIVVLALLAIMMVLVGAGFVAVSTLRGHLKVIEKRQIMRLQPNPAQSAPIERRSPEPRQTP